MTGAEIAWRAGGSCTSVDDATRLAYVEVLADEKATTAVAFLRRAVAFYAPTASPSRAWSDNGGWLWTYNHRRPHGALSHNTPIARLNDLNNPPGRYI